MDEDPGIRQRAPLPRRAPGEEDRTHGGRHPHAERCNRSAQVLHRVIDSEARVDVAPRRS